MTMKSENGRMGALVLGAAMALATIFAVVPQHALAQSWQPEISEAATKPATDSARKAPGAKGHAHAAAKPASTPAPEPVPVELPPLSYDEAPIAISPSVKPVPPSAKKPTAKDKGRAGMKKSRVAGGKPDPAKGRSSGSEPGKDAATPANGEEPPAILSSASKPATTPGDGMALPVIANELPEAAALRAILQANGQPSKTEPAAKQPHQPDAGQAAAASVPPAPSDSRNLTVIQKSSPKAAPPTETAKIAAAKPSTDIPPATAAKPAADAPKPAIGEHAAAEPAKHATSAVADTGKPNLREQAAPDAAKHDAHEANAAEPATSKQAATGPAKHDAPAAMDTPTDALMPAIAMLPLAEPIDAPATASSAPQKAAPAEKSAAKGKDRGKAKGTAARQSSANAAKAEAKPVAATANAEPAAMDEPPAVISSSPAKPGKGGKAHGKAAIETATAPVAPALPAEAPVTIIGPASIEPVPAEKLTQTTAPAIISSAAPGLRPATASAVNPQPRNEPSAPASITAGAEPEPEPVDPFTNIQVMLRRGGSEAMTTQVLPNSTPPEATGQIAPADRSPASQYCTNIADAAIDARIAWQRQNLAEAEKQITARTEELEAKTAEFQRWLARRDAFSERAQKAVIDIYTKMKPDAAALQLQAMDEEMAAAVLVKLDARSASAVMNEMDAQKAARLAAILSGAAKVPQSKGRQPPPPTGNRL